MSLVGKIPEGLGGSHIALNSFHVVNQQILGRSKSYSMPDNYLEILYELYQVKVLQCKTTGFQGSKHKLSLHLFLNATHWECC